MLRQQILTEASHMRMVSPIVLVAGREIQALKPQTLRAGQARVTLLGSDAVVSQSGSPMLQHSHMMLSLRKCIHFFDP